MNAVSKTVLDCVDIQRILAVLPHRYPFLLVDKIVDIDGDRSAVGIKNVTMNEPHFTGHFPTQPIMPGVLIIEAMAQTAGAIALLSYAHGDDGAVAEKNRNGTVYFMTIDNAKFRKPVVPGDQLRLHVEKLKQRGAVVRFRCWGEVEGEKVAEAEVTAMISVAS